MARTQLNPLDQSTNVIATVASAVTASNTVADLTFLALVVPANDLVGTCYFSKSYGQIAGPMGATQTFWVAINGSKIITIPLTLANDFTGSPLLWTLDALVTLNGSGSSTTVMVDAELLWNTNVNTSHVNGQATVNQTAQWTISCGCTMSAASSNNSVTCRQGLIRRN